MLIQRFPLILAPFLAWPCLASAAEDAPDAKVKALMEKISSDSADARYAARAEAPEAGRAAVVPLAKLLDESRNPGKDDKLRREIAITARAALEKIVHHAGRPGGGDRGALTLELARLLVPDETAKVKREVLHLIAFLGNDAVVPQVSRLLDDQDPQVRETARLSLERIPGAAAVDALVSAANRLGDDRKPDFLFSLGKKADPKAVAPLSEAAEKSRGKVRLAALEALARLAAPEAIRVFEGVLGEKDLPERAPVFNEYLRLADNLAQGNKEEEARAIYFRSLSEATLDHQRERSLFQLASARTGGRSLDALLAGLGDPGERVRKLALLRLSEMKGPEILEGLTKAYHGSKPERQAAILTVLAAKNSTGVKPLIDEAAKSPQIDLKLTALDLGGQLENPELEPTYLQAARDGSGQTKPIAVKGLLLLAKKRLDTGEKDAALSLYGKALELGTSDEQRGLALRGLLSAGEPKAIDQVGSLLKDPILGTEAANGFVILAAKIGSTGDKDRAEKHLLGILTGEFSRDVKSQAAEELRKLGRDPQRDIRSQGFLVDWWLLTPIQDPDGKALEKKFFPEEAIDLEHEQRIEARKFVWQRLKDVSLDGRINLIPSFRRIEKVITYAYTEVDSPEERSVLFKMGSDDGIACFLNGDCIHLNNITRSLKVDEDSVKANLVRGKNKILLKISNRENDWAFVFRILDAEGKPLNLR